MARCSSVAASVEAIGALQDQREVVAGAGVGRRPIEDPAERADRLLDILLGQREAQREHPIRIVRRLGHEPPRLLHRFGAAPSLRQREDQVVRGLGQAGAGAPRLFERLHRRIERPQSRQRFAEPVLNLGVARRRTGRLPQKHQRRGLIAARLEGQRAGIRVTRGRLLPGHRRSREHHQHRHHGSHRGDILTLLSAVGDRDWGSALGARRSASRR